MALAWPVALSMMLLMRSLTWSIVWSIFVLASSAVVDREAWGVATETLGAGLAPDHAAYLSHAVSMLAWSLSFRQPLHPAHATRSSRRVDGPAVCYAHNKPQAARRDRRGRKAC